MITMQQMSEALTYAATAQQVEITAAVVTVYFDQLQHCDQVELVKAVRKWVSTYDEGFRRLPTVGELRAIMRDGKTRIDPQVADEIKLSSLVKEARRRGDSEDEVQKIIDNFDSLRLELTRKYTCGVGNYGYNSGRPRLSQGC